MSEKPPDAEVMPDFETIRAFVEFVVGSCEGWIAVRAIPEKGSPSKSIESLYFSAKCTDWRSGLSKAAVRAGNAKRGLYIVPGTVIASGHARARDVAGLQTVIIDLDNDDIEGKYLHLVRYLEPPSLEVESGGLTASGQKKLHLFWKLDKPVTGDQVTEVARLRALIAKKVGGDPAFGSVHQPIRVAGSVYGKNGAQKITTIRAKSDATFVFDKLRKSAWAMPLLGGRQLSGPDNMGADSSKPTIAQVFGQRVREGGVDGTTRFDSLSRIIGYWIRRCREGHVRREQAWEEVISYNEALVAPPWPLDRLRHEFERLWLRDAQQTAKSREGATRKAGRNSRHESDPTEVALASEFTRRYSDDLRYVATRGAWYLWNGSKWSRETTLKSFDLARIVCQEAMKDTPPCAIRRKFLSAGTVAAIERLARADRRHATCEDEWDRDPWLFNTPRGVVDLKTGRLVKHDRNLLMTKIAVAAPSGDCPKWLAFLSRVTSGDIELEAYLQRVVGYCLTGLTREHILFFIYGPGANGKSVFQRVVSTILNDYAVAAPMDMFMVAKGERHPTDLAGLSGARLVTAVETEQGQRWAESRIKALIAGDPISARHMRQDFFEFIPQCKLVFAGNQKPALTSVDEAIRRRLHIIPFCVTIPEMERDPNLFESLLTEADGILQWAIEGCLKWQKIGLSPPPAVQSSTDEYFEEEDSLLRWINEECVVSPQARELTTHLYASWKKHAEESGEFAGTRTNLARALKGRGYVGWRDPSGRRGFSGIALRVRPRFK